MAKVALAAATPVYARPAATKVAAKASGGFREYRNGEAQESYPASGARPPVPYIVAQQILTVTSNDLPTILAGFVDGEHLTRWAVLSTESWAAWRRDAFGAAAAPSPSNESLLTPNGVAK
jgi:hypothetical protein